MYFWTCDWANKNGAGFYTPTGSEQGVEKRPHPGSMDVIEAGRWPCRSVFSKKLWVWGINHHAHCDLHLVPLGSEKHLVWGGVLILTKLTRKLSIQPECLFLILEWEIELSGRPDVHTGLPANTFLSLWASYMRSEKGKWYLVRIELEQEVYIYKQVW